MSGGRGGHPEPVDGIVTDEPTLGPQAPSGTGPAQDTTLERFRDWLGEHIWAEDDMGGFLQPSANPEFERQTVANVGALFDLLDPDWRSYTWSGRRGASGRRAE